MKDRLFRIVWEFFFQISRYRQAWWINVHIGNRILPLLRKWAYSENRWDICNTCGIVAMVRCGHCGNNCCNGGSGDDCPDKCASAYEMQDAGNIPPEITAEIVRRRSR